MHGLILTSPKGEKIKSCVKIPTYLLTTRFPKRERNTGKKVLLPVVAMVSLPSEFWRKLALTSIPCPWSQNPLPQAPCFHLTSWIYEQSPDCPSREVPVLYYIDTDVKLDSGFLTHPNLPKSKAQQKQSSPHKAFFFRQLTLIKGDLRERRMKYYSNTSNFSRTLNNSIFETPFPVIPRGFFFGHLVPCCTPRLRPSGQLRAPCVEVSAPWNSKFSLQ